MIPWLHWMQGGGDAGLGSAVRGAFLVRGHRGAGADAASAACDPQHRQPGAGEPGWGVRQALRRHGAGFDPTERLLRAALLQAFFSIRSERLDRKSTRLNSSHQIISYAVFCLKKKNRT